MEETNDKYSHKQVNSKTNNLNGKILQRRFSTEKMFLSKYFCRIFLIFFQHSCKSNLLKRVKFDEREILNGKILFCKYFNTKYKVELSFICPF